MSDSKHWLCVALNEEGQLIHGCLVFHAEAWAELPADQRSIKKDLKGSKLRLLQALLDDSTAAAIAHSLETQSYLDLSGHNGGSIPIGGQRRRLLDGFGLERCPTITYSAKVFPDLSDDDWFQALEHLTSIFGEDIRKHPDRLGAFLVFGDIQAAHISAPIHFEVDRHRGADMTVHPDRFSLIPDRSFEGPLDVLVELSIDGERAYAELFKVSEPKSRTVEAVPFDEYRLSVFDKSGKLIFTEGFPLLLNIGFNLSHVTQTYSLHDGLTASAEGAGKGVQEKAARVTPRSTTRSMVGLDNVAFDVHISTTRNLMQRLAPASLGDRWFPKGVASEVDVIQHLNTMLDGGRVNSAVIVDPFFGVDTLKRVIGRLESLDVKLTVVMSLTAVDPETNEKHEDLLGNLEKMLHDLRRHPQRRAIATLRVINLTDGDRQAFHDRYLLLSPHEGEREVYLLSNSLNRMAGNWPFCISKLDPATGKEAARYIDGLVQGRDISGSSRPTITFQWPRHENS